MPEEERLERAHDEFDYAHVEWKVPVQHASGDVQLVIGNLSLEFRKRVKAGWESMCWVPGTQKSNLVFFPSTSNCSQPPIPICPSSQSIGMVLGIMWTIWSLNHSPAPCQLFAA